MATKLKTVGEVLNDLDAPIDHPNLASALVATQAEMSAPRKDREVTVKLKTGGSYKFSYATMGAMVDADKPILARHGLAFVQFVTDGHMVTRIIHVSGEHLDCPLPMPNLPNAPQEAGSIITYFKRYSYSAAFGRVADEEDDANIAEGNGYTARPRQGAARPDNSADDQLPNDLGRSEGEMSSSALRASLRLLVHHINGAGSVADLEDVLDTKDAKEVIDNCKRRFPAWWETGENMPAEFVPLKKLIEQTRAGLAALEEAA